MKANRYAYIIMPVGSDFHAPSKKIAIERGLVSSGLTAFFPDYKDLQNTLWLPTLLKNVKGADAVVADLSLERPSCYYELAVAEAAGKPVHVFALSGTPIHQCAARSQVFFYHELEELTRAINVAVIDAQRQQVHIS